MDQRVGAVVGPLVETAEISVDGIIVLCVLPSGNGFVEGVVDGCVVKAPTCNGFRICCSNISLSRAMLLNESEPSALACIA